MFTDIVGYAAGFLLMLCFLPQVIKTYNAKHADDVSMGMLVTTLGSALLYEVYSLQLGLVPVFVMNGVFALLLIVEIALKVRYDRRNRSPGGNASLNSRRPVS